MPPTNDVAFVTFGERDLLALYCSAQYHTAIIAIDRNLSETFAVSRKRWLFPIPYPPFLALSTLDVWFQLLFQPRVHIPLRFWPRVLVGLIASIFITILTLPERLITGCILRWRSKSPGRGPAPVIILGYYRSGTTHLQFLMDQDPNLVSPLWYQALTPQGFFISWTLLRFVLFPFMPGKRPQDNVAFGSDVPAEDDFAMLNWCLASSLTGRHIVPEKRDFYDRYHDLKQLTPAEMSRWQRFQAGFVRKLSWLAGGRRILLKTPSHTARVEELQKLFAESGCPKFVHISRDPVAVVRSNLTMQHILNRMYHLQDPLPDEEIEARTVTEYLATEQSYLDARQHIPPGHLAEVRLENLRADPVAEMKRIYRELDLPYTDEFEQRYLDYLDATSQFKPNKHPDLDDAKKQQWSETLQPLVTQFEHDRPALPKVTPPKPRHLEPGVQRMHRLRAFAGCFAAVAVCLVIWLLLANWTQHRWTGLVWPTGIIIGLTSQRLCRRGTLVLGLWAAVLTCVALGVGAFAETYLLLPSSPLLETTWKQTADVTLLLSAYLGVVTAYGLAKRWPGS